MINRSSIQSKFYQPVAELYQVLNDSFVRCEGLANQKDFECGCLTEGGGPLRPPHYTTPRCIKDEAGAFFHDWSETLAQNGRSQHLYWRAIGGLMHLQLGVPSTDPVRIPMSDGKMSDGKERRPIFGLRLRVATSTDANIGGSSGMFLHPSWPPSPTRLSYHHLHHPLHPSSYA